MKAIVYRRFGSPDVLELAEIERPEAGEGQVQVRIRAVGLNPYDWHFLRGEPLLFRPMMGVGVRKPRRPTILGSDIAGVVESVGKDVTRFRPGDEVYGTKGPGACAEYAVTAERALALKPAGVTFEEAAAVPMAGLTALQSLRDFGRLASGQKVLVNGASGPCHLSSVLDGDWLDAGIISRPSDGLHQMRTGGRRRATGLGTATRTTANLSRKSPEDYRTRRVR